MERKNRRTLIGVVVSDKQEKTIIVNVENHRQHGKYPKKVISSKQFAVHDENKIAHVGDVVQIVETRPLSATKRFRIDKIIRKSEQDVEIKEVEEV